MRGAWNSAAPGTDAEAEPKPELATASTPSMRQKSVPIRIAVRRLTRPPSTAPGPSLSHRVGRS